MHKILRNVYLLFCKYVLHFNSSRGRLVRKNVLCALLITSMRKVLKMECLIERVWVPSFLNEKPKKQETRNFMQTFVFVGGRLGGREGSSQKNLLF